MGMFRVLNFGIVVRSVGKRLEVFGVIVLVVRDQVYVGNFAARGHVTEVLMVAHVPDSLEPLDEDRDVVRAALVYVVLAIRLLGEGRVRGVVDRICCA